MEKKPLNYNEFNKLKTLQTFALLEPEKMLALMEKLVEKKYAAGENIINQGEKGDTYYIIKSGRAIVLKKMGDYAPEQIAVIGDGEGFGEETLISEMPRNATVRALLGRWMRGNGISLRTTL